MKSICLWAWKITIEKAITLLQELSSSFIFLTFKDLVNAKLLLREKSLILCDLQTILIMRSLNSNEIHLQTSRLEWAYDETCEKLQVLF